MPSSPMTTSWRRLAGVSQFTSSIPDAPDGKCSSPNRRSSWERVLALGELRVDPRRPLTGHPAQHVGVVGGEVDRDTDVADARREGSGAPADDGEDAGEPALVQQLPQAQDRGVVALDMADLDRHPGRPARGNDRQRLRVRRGERLLHEDRHTARDRRVGQRPVEGRRGGDDDPVELGLGDHHHRIREAHGPGLGRDGRDGLGVGIGDGGQERVGVPGDDAHVVAAHGAQADEADAEPVPVRLAGHRATGVATARTAPTMVARSSSESIGWTGIARTSSDRMFVTGRSRSAAPGM